MHFFSTNLVSTCLTFLKQVGFLRVSTRKTATYLQKCGQIPETCIYPKPITNVNAIKIVYLSTRVYYLEVDILVVENSVNYMFDTEILYYLCLNCMSYQSYKLYKMILPGIYWKKTVLLIIHLNKIKHFFVWFPKY